MSRGGSPRPSPWSPGQRCSQAIDATEEQSTALHDRHQVPALGRRRGGERHAGGGDQPRDQQAADAASSQPVVEVGAEEPIEAVLGHCPNEPGGRRSPPAAPNLREHAEVVEITDLVDLSGWPEGYRMIARREDPHPGAQLTFTDVDGHRYQVFVTDLDATDLGDLEALYRGRGRAERQICDTKTTVLANLPSHSFQINRPGCNSSSSPMTCWRGPDSSPSTATWPAPSRNASATACSTTPATSSSPHDNASAVSRPPGHGPATSSPR